MTNGEMNARWMKQKSLHVQLLAIRLTDRAANRVYGKVTLRLYLIDF